MFQYVNTKLCINANKSSVLVYHKDKFLLKFVIIYLYMCDFRVYFNCLSFFITISTILENIRKKGNANE